MEDKWEPQYGNDSHPNLLSDPNCQSCPEFRTTTMEDFHPPKVQYQPRARKKEMLKQFYWKQFSQEFFDQLGKMPGKEDSFANSTTTYNDEYGIPGFKPKGILDLIDPELHAKYPLYSDTPYTVYQENVHRIKASARTKHPQTVFRKSSSFVKKWYEELE